MILQTIWEFIKIPFIILFILIGFIIEIIPLIILISVIYGIYHLGAVNEMW